MTLSAYLEAAVNGILVASNLSSERQSQPDQFQYKLAWFKAPASPCRSLLRTTRRSSLRGLQRRPDRERYLSDEVRGTMTRWCSPKAGGLREACSSRVGPTRCARFIRRSASTPLELHASSMERDAGCAIDHLLLNPSLAMRRDFRRLSIASPRQDSASDSCAGLDRTEGQTAQRGRAGGGRQNKSAVARPGFTRPGSTDRDQRRFADFIAPQLCESRAAAQGGLGHEVKLDGYRTQIRVGNAKAVLRTRTGSTGRPGSRSWQGRQASSADGVIDGEVVDIGFRRVPRFRAASRALEGQDRRSRVFAFGSAF